MTAKRFFSGHLVLGLLLSALTIQPAIADTLEIKGDAPQTYTVVKGDTLWDISGRYLDKPWLWPDLWAGNPQITNPHLIYPGDVIYLYYVDGQPRLGINRGHGNVKLSPRIRATRIDDAIPVVPVEAIQQFLRNLKVLDKTSMEKAPYIIRSQEGRILAAKGDRVYAMDMSTADAKDYQIYHLGDPIKDPVSGDVIAHEGIFVGDAKLETMGSPATLLMTTSRRETAVGDRLVSSETDEALSNFYPTVPDSKLQGQVLNVVDGTGIYGRFQAVIINLGAQDGLTRGHVLSVFNKGETVINEVTPDPKDQVTLPSERAGTVMVIRAFENLSYALVMESRRPMYILDEVRTPE